MDSEYKILSRLKQTSDGLDFIELVQSLSKKNYEEFKVCDRDRTDVHKGIAIAYDNLIKLFQVCDDKLKQVDSSVSEGHY